MSTTRKLLLPCAALVTVLGLAACGGGGGGGNGFAGLGGAPAATTTTPPPTTQPVAASDPFDAFIARMKDMVNSALDTSEPEDVAAFDPPPTSETKEPIAVQ